jgi:hypothetical protein
LTRRLQKTIWTEINLHQHIIAQQIIDPPDDINHTCIVINLAL